MNHAAVGTGDIGVSGAVEDYTVGKAKVRLGAKVRSGARGVEVRIAAPEGNDVCEESGEDTDFACAARNFADQIVVAVGDIDVVIGVDAQSPGIAECSVGGWASVAEIISCDSEAAASGAVAGKERNHPAGSDLPNHVIGAIRDINIVARVDNESGERIKPGARSRRCARGGVESGIGLLACKCAQIAGRGIDSAHNEVIRVGDKQVAVGIVGHAHRRVELADAGVGQKAVSPEAPAVEVSIGGIEPGDRVEHCGNEEDGRRWAIGWRAVLLRDSPRSREHYPSRKHYGRNGAQPWPRHPLRADGRLRIGDNLRHRSAPSFPCSLEWAERARRR